MFDPLTVDKRSGWELRVWTCDHGFPTEYALEVLESPVPVIVPADALGFVRRTLDEAQRYREHRDVLESGLVEVATAFVGCTPADAYRSEQSRAALEALRDIVRQLGEQSDAPVS